MPKLSSIQNFGEQFLFVIQNLKKERTEKEQFEKEMRYKFRQMNLLNERYKAEEDRLQNQFDYNVSQDFTKVQEGAGITGRQNPRTGGFDTHLPLTTGKEVKETFGADIGEGNFVKNSLLPQTPEAPDLTGDRYETKQSNTIGTGKYKGQKVDIIRDKFTNDEFEQPIYKEPKGGNDTESKGSSLKEFEIKALNNLEEPILNVRVKNAEGIESEAPMTPSETKRYLFDNFNVVANAHLKNNEALGWLKRYIKKRGWIPSTTEITNAVNDDKDLSDVAVDQLVDYLQIHRGMNPGLIKIQHQAGMLPK